MTQVDQAKTILRKVLTGCQLESDESLSCWSNGNRRYLVIPGNESPRWIVPENSKYARRVLDQWQPYGVLSRFKWRLLCLLYRLQVIRFVPGIYRITSVNDKALVVPGDQVDAVPVIYVGTPGVQQKAVVTLVGIRDTELLAVMKVALSAGAHASLRHEATVLKQLAGLGVPNVPQLMHNDVESQRIWQTVLMGRPTSRKLTGHHVEWLLTLPKSGRVTTPDEQGEILRNLLKSNKGQMPSSYRASLKNAIDTIKGKDKIPLVLVHGDFAPWNVMQQTDRSLLVMDWEDAKFDGLPLWDISHFHYMQAHLFNEKAPIKLLKSGEKMSQYLDGLGVRRSAKQMLSLLYCLYQIMTGDNVSKEYKYLLFDQLPELCAR